MTPSYVMRLIATICFVLAAFSIATPVQVSLIPLGLALWCGSSLVR